MLDLSPVVSFLTHFSYIGAFSSIVVSGYVLPVPEEIVLLTIGYLSSTGLFNIYLAIIVSFLATLISDIFLYSLAKKDSKFTKRMKAKLQSTALVTNWMKKPNSIGKSVFMMRFVVGLRFLGPILAGAMNVSLRKFVFFDILALLIYVPFFVILGNVFSSSFLRIAARVDSIRHIIFLIAITGLGIILLNVANKNLWRIGIGSRKVVEAEEEATS